MPGRLVPTAMFSVCASTSPAPATPAPNGARAGGTGGSSFGGFCCARTTWYSAKNSITTAARGKPILRTMTVPPSGLDLLRLDPVDAAVAHGHDAVAKSVDPAVVCDD